MEDSNTGKVLKTLGSLSILECVGLTCGLLFVRWIARGIYQVYFHPLRRFPGPKISAFTRIPYFYATVTGNEVHYLSRLHDEYGDVVRTMPDALSFNDSQGWRDIYGHGPKEGHGSSPPKFWPRYGRPPNKVNGLIGMKDDAEHNRVRKIFTPAFSERALRQQESIFQKYTDQFARNIKNAVKQGKGSAKVDMVQQYNFTTFDIMADLAFGESLHMLEKNEYDPWVSGIFKGIRMGNIMQNTKVYYPLVWKVIELLFSKTIQEKRQVNFRHSVTRVSKRLDKGRETQGTDIWDLVLSQEEKGKQGLTREQMDSNAALFMVAGTETTATLLSGLTHLLLHHPEAKKKLAEELRGAFATNADISMDGTAKLPYLNGCIKEGLRLYPPVAVGLPHFTPPEGSTICGEFVPPNTIVHSQHHVMYRSPRYFKNPNAFIPERWTGDPEYASDERSCVQPFSVGTRDCLGRNMAYHEMRLLIAKVFYNFDLEPTPENKGWFDQKMYLVWEKKPLVVNVRPAGTT